MRVALPKPKYTKCFSSRDWNLYDTTTKPQYTKIKQTQTNLIVTIPIHDRNKTNQPGNTRYVIIHTNGHVYSNNACH